MEFDFKSLSKLQWVTLGAGLLSLLLSFFGSYVRVSVNTGVIGNISSGANAWHSYATLGILLIVAATALAAVLIFAKEILPAGVPWNLIALAASGLGALLLILRALTVSSGSLGALGASVGPGWSGWLLFITSITLTVCLALTFKDSGEKLPELKKPDAPGAA